MIGQLINYVILSFKFLWQHKWKVTLTVWFAIVFVFILFPMNDLNDLITVQVSKLTQRNVFLQFNSMSINPFGPKLTLEKVFVESGSVPTISADELTVSPSLMALINKKVEGHITAQGFLKGDVDIQIKTGPKTDAGLERSKIEIQAKNINLKDLRELASLPVSLKGSLNLTTSALVELTFADQPEGDVNIVISKFEMPSSSVALADLGRVNLPEMKLGQIELKGRLAAGKFVIESGKLGNPTDELHGDIKGDLGLTFQNRGGQIVPLLGGYNIDLNLNATPAFKERAKFFLGFLDGYKTDLPNGTVYKFKIRAASAGMSPQFTPLR